MSSRVRVLFLLLAITTVAAVPAAAQVPTDTAAWWKLDETSGLTAADSSSHSNTATLSSTATPAWGAGKFSNGLIFDGVDDDAAVATPSGLAGTQFAISAWVKYTATDTKGGEVASMGDNYGLRVTPGGDVKVFIHTSNGTWPNATTSGVNTKDGAWHHLLGQYDGTQFQVWIDGTLSQTVTVAAPIVYSLGTQFHLGHHGNGDADHDFNGSIDQVRVYARALTGTEIVALAGEGTIIPSDTSAWFKLDDASGLSAADSSGHGNAAQLSSTATPAWSTGRFSGALTFDGVDDDAEVAAPAGVEGAQYAISAWVNYSATDTKGGEVASMGDSYGLRVTPAGDVKAFIYTGGNVWSAAVSSGVNTKDGAWHHLVSQYDGSQLQVWVDGVLAQAVTVGAPISYSLGSGFHLGHHGNANSSYDFNGTIDQVRVYARALSGPEITALAAETASGAPPVAIKVLEWNVRKCRGTDTAPGGKDCDRVASAVWSLHPDVVILGAVETMDDANRIVTVLNQLEGPQGTWTKHFEIAGSEGQVILTQYTKTDLGSHEVLASTCGASENQIIVGSAIAIGTATVNFFAIDQESGSGSSYDTIRSCQAQAFLTWANGFGGTRIIAGDFNSNPGTSGITTYLNPGAPDGYTDAWGRCPTRREPGIRTRARPSATPVRTASGDGRCTIASTTSSPRRAPRTSA